VFCCAIGMVAAVGIGDGLVVSAHDFWIVLAMGGLTIGIGIACVTWGSAYLPAAETSLLVLIESVLGPIWVWMFVAEAMTAPEMLGGAIVLGAVAAQALVPRLMAPTAFRAAATRD
jgi:drug/metabolite transporter, DME family